MTSLISAFPQQWQAHTVVSDQTGLRNRFLEDPGANKTADRFPSVVDTAVCTQGKGINENAPGTVAELFDQGPDIDWIPSFETYQRRVETLARRQPYRENDVPVGFPRRVDGERSWTGSGLHCEEDYVTNLSETDIDEVLQALLHFKCRYPRVKLDLPLTALLDVALPGNLEAEEVQKDTFPLPILGNKLARVSREIHSGRGFAVLRGLNAQDLSLSDNLLVYLGISCHIAELRGCQDTNSKISTSSCPSVMENTLLTEYFSSY